MQYLIGFAVVIGLIYVAFMFLMLASVNLVALADRLFGGIAFVDPALSWAIIGFILAAGLHFAFLEAPKLNRGILKPLFIGAFIVLLAFIMIIGLPARGEQRKEIGRQHLSRAKELAKKPGNENEAVQYRKRAIECLGHWPVEGEMPTEVVHYPDQTYTFKLKTGEQTPYWIAFPRDISWSYKYSWPDECKFERIFYGGKVYGQKVSVDSENPHKFKFRAITDSRITMTVKKKES